MAVALPRPAAPPLGTHPVFRGCSRDEMRRICRWGDHVALPAGEVLLTEDTIPQSFFVIINGCVEVTRAGRLVTTLGVGDHVGGDAILGFAPQPTTVVTTEPCHLFVIGRRYFISMTYDVAGLRRGLWDDIDEIGLNTRLREMRAAGARAWAEMSPAARAAAAVTPDLPPWVRRPPPGPTPGFPGAFHALAAGALDRSRRAAVLPRPRPIAIGLRGWLAVLALTAVALTVFALVYHPPVVVVVPGRPVDIVGDISIEGRRSHPVSGEYVMATVEFRRPTLAGLLVAGARGERTMSAERLGDDPDRSRRLGREAFRQARRRAVAAAAAAAGIDPVDLDVRFRDRAVSGSSAAMVYGLAVVDLLDPEDRAAGRTVAATGGLTADGTVVPIDYPDEKWRVARTADADLFLVPAGQHVDAGGRGMPVMGVTSLSHALAVLRDAAD